MDRHECCKKDRHDCCKKDHHRCDSCRRCGRSVSIQCRDGVCFEVGQRRRHCDHGVRHDDPPREFGERFGRERFENDESGRERFRRERFERFERPRFERERFDRDFTGF